jgi:hypothetical protein
MFAAAVIVLWAAAPAHAQAPSSRARMDAFVAVLRDESQDSVASFLPRQGPLTWVLTTRRPGGESLAGRWIFESGDLKKAMDFDGPLCNSFTRGGDAIPLESLVYVTNQKPGRWRRVGANRFVPPGAPARSATFVQWRREGGRWVIGAFGNEVWARVRVLGVEPNGIIRDPGGPPVLPGPPDALYAAGTPWYQEHLPLRSGDQMLSMYGPPRAIDADLLQRFGFVNGVPVYREAGTGGTPEVVYVPVGPDGLYQPYQNMTGSGCA